MVLKKRRGKSKQNTIVEKLVEVTELRVELQNKERDLNYLVNEYKVKNGLYVSK